MGQDTEIMYLEDMDTGMIEGEGWKLDKMFYDDEEKTMDVHNQAMKYAEVLSGQCVVGIRPVTQSGKVYMEVYKKED